MALPSFLCIGATKAGTTWLHEQLDTHPQVCMPAVKELHYFSALHDEKHLTWATAAVTKAMQRELRKARKERELGTANKDMVEHMKGLMSEPIFTNSWYRHCFDRPDRKGKTYGEITPAYAELSDESITDLCRQLPGVKIIHILRHPVDRALSHLRMTVHRREAGDTDKELMRLIEKNTSILGRGEYQKQLPRWRAAIPAENMLIVPFGRVKHEPYALLADVEKFLGVDAFADYPVAKQVNSTRSIEISPQVVAFITKKVEPTMQFIRAEFGDEFLESTR